MSKELCESIVKILDEKRAENIKAIAIAELTVVADYFVIATANSTTHLRALADDVEVRMTAEGQAPNHTEGRATGWILLDFGTVVVHLFLKDAREYYNLERLWDDGSVMDITHLITQ